jgi:hypothetical protein
MSTHGSDTAPATTTTGYTLALAGADLAFGGLIGSSASLPLGGLFVVLGVALLTHAAYDRVGGGRRPVSPAAGD